MLPKERVIKTLNCEKTDRPPLYDLLRNDAVIEHFSGEKLTIENGRKVSIKAMSEMLDATKQFMRFPQKEEIFISKTLPFAYSLVMPEDISGKEGYRVENKRWTSWGLDHESYDKNRVVSLMNKVIKSYNGWDERSANNLKNIITDFNEKQSELGEAVLFACISEVGFMAAYEVVGGIDKLSYLMYDEPKVLSEFYEVLFQMNLDKIKNLPGDFNPVAAFVPEDIAYGSGTMVSPDYIKREFTPRLKKIVEAYHEKGIKVIFHCDGNLWQIMDELVDCGIDGLNPIETLAGMDIGRLRKRYPKLVLVGGIDCSKLLPFGSVEEVKSFTRKSIDEAKYGYFVGSSSEIHNKIPLENILAMVNEAKG